ncbi:helix-turn-helix domain-containing protein [Streptomyces sp. NPDC004647]|uniref:helix-turn-helix domain-containing protein n=1 Tax=Streptomyces sp. NPDC004647 TaxID=3154671 RepID=UPI0033AEF01A
MNDQLGEPAEAAPQALDNHVQAAKAAIASRLRYIRKNHPQGPFTLDAFAERTQVSKRTLSAAESADGTNLTIEIIAKIAHSLGIERHAYFLDEHVFQQINSELELVKNLRDGKVGSVALRASHSDGIANPAVDQLTALLSQLVDTAQAASDTLPLLDSSGDAQLSAQEGHSE